MRKNPKEVLWSAWLASLAIPKPVSAVVVCTGCHSHTRAWTEEISSSRFWSPDVQGQGVGRVSFSWGFSLWLCPHMALLLCMHLLLSLLIKTSVLLDQAPTLWPHLTLITSLKAPSPNILILGIRASTYDLRRGHILANNDWLWIQGERGEEAFPPKEGKPSPGGQN